MIRAKCFIIMSYIITEEEISTLNADDQILKFLIDILVLACESVDHVSKKYGMCVTEIIQGLNNLSVNDDNKVRLVRLGIVPLYLGLLKEYRQEEVLFVVNGLWKLSFHHTNKEVMRRSGCVQEAEYVYKLRKSFIPLRLQTGYIPDGWLGIMIGTKLYFDFSKESYIEEQTPNLIKELGDRGRVPVYLNSGDSFDVN
ncbi:hypothetical protein KUTeg_015105 [Tegillarca granosa]|uniref:Uncharacterized protein n=1 Tax=Tegillarca granosa TaxID=220873 RepID=A0ABQ9ERM0_TEGGR|nr:hypothetical protein KUTeg_015105 [Tegillarca granosa]